MPRGYTILLIIVAFDPVTPSESAFPLAFSHAVHHNVGVLEVMLVATLRPTDAHCIYVDSGRVTQESYVEMEESSKQSRC